jgi:cobalt-zinc-cadmium efflux system outer membrane protein
MLTTLVTGVALTLAEAYGRAARQNPELIAAQAHLPVVEAGVTTAGALPNPVLSVSSGRDEPTIIGGVGMRLPIFGQRSATIAAALAELPVSQALVAQRSVELHAVVRRDYFALAVAQAHATLGAEAAKLSKELADVTQKRFDAGAAPLLDVTQAALAARRAAQDQRTQDAARDAAEPALNAALGEQPEAPVEAVDALSQLPEVAPIEAYLAQLDHHPTLTGIQSEQQAALARVAREHAVVRPAPDLTVELSQLTAQGGLGVRGTLAFETPLLSRNRGPIDAAQAEATEAVARERAARTRLAAAVRSAWLRLRAAISRAHFFAEEQVPAAQKVESLARLAYQEGRTPLVGVLQAQTDVNAAKLQAVDAWADAQTALADLEEATGVGF